MMKTRAIIILSLSMLVVPFISFGSASSTCFTASGFGSAGANTSTYTYYDASGYGAVPWTYFNGTDYLYSVNSGGLVLNVGPVLGNGGSDYYKLDFAGSSWFDYVGSWNVNAGTPPAGTIATTTCASASTPILLENQIITMDW